MKEYLPEEEVHTLRQVAYLALMTACFINVMYTLIYVNTDTIYFAVLDITLSLYIAATIDKSKTICKLFVLLLVPYGALHYLLFGSPLIGLIDLIHVPVFIYFMKYYYDKFDEYTELHSLGIAIVLLFTIIFVSFIITSLVEAKTPLDAIVMVSNAFTSNGYVVLGHTDVGKINALVLVWMGFILSGAGTATLTAAILMRRFKGKLKDYDDKFEDLSNKFDEVNDNLEKLEKLIKDND
ncbi:hypothetical protein [Methanobrevibacter sp.]|uniref:hypothetical protein n=1 Tax=Methanobrevibacter sp. TaxID=66852 RepID=UPI00386394C5